MRVFILPALAGALVLAWMAQPAAAATPNSWNCRATVAAVSGALPRIEPLVANGDSATGADRDFCATDDAGPAPINLALLSTTTARATTRIASSPPATQAPASDAVAENLSILGPAGVLVGATAINSSASGSCVGGSPQLSGGSQVLGAKVLGQSVSADGVLTIVGNTLNGLPTGQVLTVKFNQQERSGASLTQRAVDVELRAGTTTLVRAIAGETKVSAQGDPCSATTGGPGGGGGGGGGNGGGNAQPCPVGATYEQANNLCVILRQLPGGQGERIVVGPPGDASYGGRVIAVADLPASLRNTVCAKGKGPKFAILGTEGRDNITGTSRADRILSLGGKDKVSGGNGADCIDGGSGGGTLSGGPGKDRLVGCTGRDYLKGGADTDAITGGKGADRITTDFGADKVDAGPGKDLVNASVAGKPARVNCGSGRDVVSLNPNERRRAKGCERMKVLGSKR